MNHQDAQPAESAAEKPATEAEERSEARHWIPRNNPAAVAGYYCGIFSWIPVLGFLFAPVALILGIYGYRQARLDRKLEGRTHALVGIVMGFIALAAWPFLTIVLWQTWEAEIRAFLHR